MTAFFFSVEVASAIWPFTWFSPSEVSTVDPTPGTHSLAKSSRKFRMVRDVSTTKWTSRKSQSFSSLGPFHIFSPLFGSKNVFFSPQSFRELVVPPSTKVQAELSIRKPHEPRVTFRSSRKNTGKWMQMMQIDANCRSHRCHRHDTATVFACSKIGSAKSPYAWLQTVQGEWWTRVNLGELDEVGCAFSAFSCTLAMGASEHVLPRASARTFLAAKWTCGLFFNNSISAVP